MIGIPYQIRLQVGSLILWISPRWTVSKFVENGPINFSFDPFSFKTIAVREKERTATMLKILDGVKMRIVMKKKTNMSDTFTPFFHWPSYVHWVSADTNRPNPTVAQLKTSERYDMIHEAQVHMNRTSSLVIFPHTLIEITVSILKDAFAVCFIVYPAATEHVSVRVNELTLSTFLSRVPRTNVLVSICIGQSTDAMREVGFPLSLCLFFCRDAIRADWV